MSTPESSDPRVAGPVEQAVNSSADLALAAPTPPIPVANNQVRATWAISLSELRANIAHCCDETRRIFPEAFLFCQTREVTRAEFAAQIEATGKRIHGKSYTFSQNLVYQFCKGIYKNPDNGTRIDLSEKNLKAVKQWLREQRSYLASSFNEKDFVVTPSTRRVFLAVDFARESRTPVPLYGPSHVGKSCALTYKHLTENHGLTPYVRIPAVGGLNELFAALCRAVGQSPHASFPKMRRGLLGALAPDMCVILDEVHLLLNTYRKESFFACIEAIRELYDRVGFGLVLCSTDLGRDKFYEQERKKELDQMLRRGVHRFQLSAPTVEDLRLILLHHGLEFPKPRDRVVVGDSSEQPFALLKAMSKDSGLKAITERVRYGKKFAAKEGRPLAWEDFVRAHLTIELNAATPATGWEQPGP